MLEKIGSHQYSSISKPAKLVIQQIQELKESGKKLCVAEVGVGVGATSIEIVRLLDENDTYYMFDFENIVSELKTDLEQLDFCKATIYAYGNSRKTFDSFVWSLAKLWQNSTPKEIFDVIYLDGGHSFFHSGLACCLLKKLCKPDGILIFDDVDWTYAGSKKARASGLKNFTIEQAETCQIAMVIDIFMKDDKDWEYLEDYSTTHRATFKKRN